MSDFEYRTCADSSVEHAGPEYRQWRYVDSAVGCWESGCRDGLELVMGDSKLRY